MISAVGREEINMMGLIVLKGDLKLAKVGIKRRGYNARTLAKKVTGLKTNDCDKLIAAVQEKIDAMAESGVRFHSV